jgi:hypothetical protein
MSKPSSIPTTLYKEVGEMLSQNQVCPTTGIFCSSFDGCSEDAPCKKMLPNFEEATDA